MGWGSRGTGGRGNGEGRGERPLAGTRGETSRSSRTPPRDHHAVGHEPHRPRRLAQDNQPRAAAHGREHRPAPRDEDARQVDPGIVVPHRAAEGPRRRRRPGPGVPLAPPARARAPGAPPRRTVPRPPHQLEERVVGFGVASGGTSVEQRLGGGSNAALKGADADALVEQALAPYRVGGVYAP